MTLELGTIIGNKYVVRRKLAEGGMAEIFLCSARGAQGFAKEVVLKRIRSYLAVDPEFVRMFIAEARLACLLNHANVVQIFDFDKDGDTYYLAMEYVQGRSLWEVRVRARELLVPCPPTLVAHIGAQVARGLDYAHRLTDNGQPLGLIHRDVSPQNVLISFDGAVKLADFGIARAGGRSTVPGVLKGKFAYMSPEQARGEDLDPRSDVFALGVVLWELLTNSPLFDEPSDIKLLQAIQFAEIRPPSEVTSAVHPELSSVVMKALEREPARRFQSAHELERALGRFVLDHAESLEDTDPGTFLRLLFGEPGTEERIRPQAPTLALPPPPREESHSLQVSPPPLPHRSRLPRLLWTVSAVAALVLGAVVATRVLPHVHVDWSSSQRANDPEKRPVAPPTTVTAPPKQGEAPPLQELDAGTTSQRTEAPVPEPPVAPPPAIALKPKAEPLSIPRGVKGALLGTLTVRALPWANVTIDGRGPREISGDLVVRLVPGRHKIKFVHPRLSRELDVDVRLGQNALAEFNAINR